MNLEGFTVFFSSVIIYELIRKYKLGQALIFLFYVVGVCALALFYCWIILDKFSNDLWLICAVTSALTALLHRFFFKNIGENKFIYIVYVFGFYISITFLLNYIERTF